ncbi:hypothetical protein J2847_006655 [Azospirillum agricola]|nr:hypothetical protein [Azospirillum agricola]
MRRQGVGLHVEQAAARVILRLPAGVVERIADGGFQ